MKQIEVKEMTVLKGQISKLENQATAVTIEDPKGYSDAIDIVARLKEIGSNIKNKKESITKPLNEALRNARELFKPIEEQFINAEKIVKTKLLDYKRAEDEKARIEEEKIAARVEKGTLKMETAERKIGEVERVDNSSQGKVGKIEVRKIKKVRIVDEMAIPRDYLIPDMVKIRREALEGKQIAGVEIYDEEIVSAGKIYHDKKW